MYYCCVIKPNCINRGVAKGVYKNCGDVSQMQNFLEITHELGAPKTTKNKTKSQPKNNKQIIRSTFKQIH